MGPLHDIIYDHPQWIVIVCLAWIAIGVWVVSLVGWMIQGEVDTVFGIVGIAIAFVLGYFSFMPPSEMLRPFTALAVILTVIIFPILRNALNKRELLAIDMEAMENAYDMLRQKPENHYVRFKLAKLLYERGHLLPGLAVGAEALREMPEKLFNEEHRMYARWRRVHPEVNLSDTIACIDCGHRNPAYLVNCERCGHPHLLGMARGKLVGTEFARKLIAGWIAGILALAGIPMASLLPPIPAIAAIVLIMVGAIALIWMAFRSSGEASRA